MWENILMIMIVYNFVTFCYFFAVPDFPSSVWLYFEFLSEILMIVDLLIRFLVLKIVFNKDQN